MLNAQDTIRGDQNSLLADQQKLQVLLRQGDVVVQRYAPELVEEGEWSLVFINGRCSQAVLKRAAPSDFPVQQQFGGVWQAVEPEASLLTCAVEAVWKIPQLILYARVDGVLHRGAFLRSAVELIAPSLYFEFSGQALARFSDAILALCAEGAG